MTELERRKIETELRLSQLTGKLSSASVLIHGKACVYATGSFGRREASQYSDLDLFIVGKKNGKPGLRGMEGSLLKRLDEICIKADLIEAIRDLKIPDFDGDGRYLFHHSVHEFTKTLGTPEDDVTNTFTARLLLLLESTPLLEADVYQEIIEEVIAEYWLDYGKHKHEFVPAFLANDVLRLWRTFCVNYEARTERQPEEKMAKRKIKNYKLKHSRLLTCYSTLLYLLGRYNLQGTVSPDDAREMIKFTPVQRLEWLLNQKRFLTAHSSIQDLLDSYNTFLEATNTEETGLIYLFMNKDKARDFMKEASKFGDKVFDILSEIGAGNKFHRLLVI